MAYHACQTWMATSRNGRSIKRYPIGFFHIDIAEVQTAEGKLYLFVGIDRTSTFAVTRWRVQCHSGRQKVGEIVCYPV